jgi:hypothetical protein
MEASLLLSCMNECYSGPRERDHRCLTGWGNSRARHPTDKAARHPHTTNPRKNEQGGTRPCQQDYPCTQTRTDTQRDTTTRGASKGDASWPHRKRTDKAELRGGRPHRHPKAHYHHPGRVLHRPSCPVWEPRVCPAVTNHMRSFSQKSRNGWMDISHTRGRPLLGHNS